MVAKKQKAKRSKNGEAKQPKNAPLPDTDREARILRAVADVKAGVFYQEAQLLHRIPRATIYRRLTGKSQERHAAHIHEQTLTPAMEHGLVKFCKHLEELGFPPRLDLVRSMASVLAETEYRLTLKPGQRREVGAHWVSRFLQSHPELRTRYASNLDKQRQKAGHPATLREYFRLLQRLFRKYNFRPQDVYNMDEKGFILGYSARFKVICQAWRHTTRMMSDPMRELVTVIECVGADGFTLAPFVIQKGKQHSVSNFQDVDNEDAVFGISPNGWTDNELAIEWVKFFDRETRPRAQGRERLLILDGHGSHITTDFIAYCEQNGIVLFGFPAHTTHILQPLDIVVFGSLQHHYGSAVADHMRMTGVGINKASFWRFYTRARRLTFRKELIKSSFRAAGIFPFNPDKVLNDIVRKHEEEDQRRHGSIPTGLRTPTTRHELRQQKQTIVDQIVGQDADAAERTRVSNIVARITHLAESASTQAELAEIRTRQLQQKYAGKKKAQPDKRCLTKARVITGYEAMRLYREKTQPKVSTVRSITKTPRKRSLQKESLFVTLHLRPVTMRQFIRDNAESLVAEAGAAVRDAASKRAEQADDSWEDVPKPEARTRRQRKHVGDGGTVPEAAGQSAEAARITKLEAELAAVKEQLASSRPREPERQCSNPEPAASQTTRKRNPRKPAPESPVMPGTSGSIFQTPFRPGTPGEIFATPPTRATPATPVRPRRVMRAGGKCVRFV